MKAVVGLGDPGKGDQGVGARVLALMSPRPDTLRLELTRDMLSLVDLGKACEEVILVDSVLGGGAPGQVLAWQLTAPVSQAILRDGVNLLARFSAHAVDLSQVLLMAESLEQLPERLTLYGVIGQSFKAGQPLSAPVEAAAVELARTLSGQA